MKIMRGLVAGILCVAAVGASARSFERWAPAAQIAAVQGPLEWRTVAGPDGAFTAEMPGAPAYSKTEGKTQPGTAYTSHQYIVEKGPRAFILTATVFDESADFSDAREYLQRLTDDGASREESGKWISVDWKTVQGFTAVETVGFKRGFEWRTLWVLRGRQLISLLYAGRPGTTRSEDAGRFLESLNIR